MTWRTGKHGHHTGRTVRSPFARSSARREGVLIKKVKQTSGNISDEGLTSFVETTSYSLGKQNRWLMPALIKSSANPREVVGEENDFILVEQRMDDRETQKRRGRCISVYNSSTRKTRKPRRRYGEAQSLMSDSSHTELEFEVHYPNTKGVWPLNSEVKYGQKCRGKRKGSSKNRRGKWNESHWNVMAEEEDGNEDEDHDDVEDYDDDMCHEESKAEPLHHSIGEYISLFIDQDKKAPCSQTASTYKSTDTKEKSDHRNIIIVDDEELVAEHERLVSRARKMDSLILKYLRYNRHQLRFLQGKKAKGRKKRALLEYAAKLFEEYEKETGSDLPNENENSSMDTLNFAPDVYPSCEVIVKGAEILPSELRQTWGSRYRECNCVPRKFIIDLSGFIRCHENLDLTVMVVLFELKDQMINSSKLCKASIKLVLHEVVAEQNSSLGIDEIIKAEFLESMCGKGTGISRVKDIVDIGVSCIEKHYAFEEERPIKASPIHNKNPFFTSDVFVEVLGWRGKSCTEKEALVEAKMELERENRKTEAEDFCVSSLSGTECGICFEDLKDEVGEKYTTLISCGHSFCSSCWELYIKSMLNVGETNLLCPGHQCKTSLDDIIIMSLATSWYGRYFSWKIKKSLARDPTLKHCPSEGCHLVMKVTTCNKSAQKTISHPLPVVCACNQSWCFKCQESAHWPAQCEEAQNFRTEYKAYSRRMMTERERKKEITSVMVKKCPNCSYPIEKFQGCDHMYCSLCGVEFCWLCLQVLDMHHYYNCPNKSIAPSEFLLPKAQKNKMQTLTDIALSNNFARKSSHMLAVQRKLKSVEQGINAYCFLKTGALKNLKSSRITSVLEGMIKHETLQRVKDAFDFKSQAHVVVEGLAIVLLKGVKDSYMYESLQNDMKTLIFIVDELDKLIRNPCSVCNRRMVDKLTRLIDNGKWCIRNIKRHGMKLSIIS